MPQRAAARAQPRAHGARNVAAVERLGALIAEQLERIAELVVAQHLALAQDAPGRRPQALRTPASR